jgi:hemolysin activation/secretion protein
VIGNQIQIAEEEPELNQNISNLIDVSYEFPLNNNKFTLKFSEKELKE